MAKWMRVPATFLISGCGAAVFLLAGWPLPWLFGPLAACLIAAICGAPLQAPGRITILARPVIGVAIGAAVTPALWARLPGMAASMALIPFYIALIALIGIPWFHRVCGFDRKTALYAAMPGGAADMTLFAQDAGANIRQVSLVHVTRLAFIMLCAPLVLTHLYGVELNALPGVPARSLPWGEIVLMAAAGLIGWKLGERIGLFGAAIIGPLLIAMALSLAGVLHMRPPREALVAAQFLIGTGIGSSYAGVTLREIRKIILGAVAFVILLAVLTALFTETVILALDGPPVETFLAFAPGGQAEMTMLAMVAEADLGFVVAHHLARVFLVVLGTPLLMRLFEGKRDRSGDRRP